MEYMMIQRPGFREELREAYEQFANYSDEELVRRYNRQVEIGIVGAYAQAIHLLALRILFIERFGHSPVVLKDEIVIAITEKVKVENGGLYYLDGRQVLGR